MSRKLSQKQIIFYLLYQNHKEKGQPLPPHKFMGEVYVKPAGEWGFVSYEASARLSEINKENPGLLEITPLTGKSGAHYYGYTLKENKIADESLKEMYRQIKEYEMHQV